MGVIDRVGQPTAEHVAYAADLLARMPERLKAAAREPVGARAVVLGLLLPREEEPRRALLRGLLQRVERPVYNTLLQLLPDLDGLSAAARLPLIDLSLPALRRLEAAQYPAFRTDIEELIRADQRVELFEWMLHRLVVRHLDRHYWQARPRGLRHRTLRPLLDPIACLLSTLAYAGQRESMAVQGAYDAGWGVLGVRVNLWERAACRLEAVSEALDELAAAAPGIKKKVLEACAACVNADGQVQVREAELLRTVADALDCPMPPLLPV